MSSDLSISERRIKPIQDAVTSGNYKQALQLCDKWQKKGEKSDKFLALKASVLVCQSDHIQVEKGKAETLQLCRRAAPVTDIEAIYQLQDSLKHLSLQNEEGPKLWERAVAVLPNNKDFLTAWLNGSISDNKWLIAQKAAMALRKAFPKERQHDFLNIVLCYLIHSDESSLEKERVLFGTLAYRLISKAADAVPVDKSQLLAPGNAIQTLEELALLTKIYISTQHADEALNLLQSQKLGLTSMIAERDPQMAFSLLLEVLESLETPKVVLDTCSQLLSPESSKAQEYAEDDRIWRIVTKVAQIGDAELYSRSRDLTDTILIRYIGCRAAFLAKLELLTFSTTSEGDQRTKLMDTCREYYEVFKEKPFCFNDLVRALQLCGPDSIREFMDTTVSSDATDSQRMFALKLDYSMLSENTSRDIDFYSFAKRAITLHKNFPKHKTECPEAAVLAALSILRLAAKTNNITHAIQASFVLERAYSSFGDFYPSAIWLVQLHRVLGLVSLAMQHFGSLSVKNMQWETVGHLLLTRISSLHPLQVGQSKKKLSPLNALDAGLNMMVNMQRSLDTQIKNGLEYGSYSNVLDSVTVKHNGEASLNRQVFAIEERKIYHLIGMPVDAVQKVSSYKLVDRRDFAYLDKYGVIDEGFDSYMRCGPLPMTDWLDAMTVSDHLKTALSLELAGQTTPATQAFAANDKAVASLRSPDKSQDPNQSLTPAELFSLQCYRSIGKAAAVIRGSETSKQLASLDTSLDEIKAWLEEVDFIGNADVNGVEVPTWEYLHLCFTRLETIQTTALLVGFLARKSKSTKTIKGPSISKEKISELQKAVTDAEAAIHQKTKSLKDSINGPGVLGKLIDVAAGRLEESDDSFATDQSAYREFADVFADCFDEVEIEEYCGKMKDSWEDALDGILAIKVRILK